MSLSGKTLCFTGTLTSPRASCMAQAQAAGAGVAASVTGKVTHLVAGPGAGSKVSAAQAKGVEIWTEAEFFAAMAGGGGAKGKKSPAAKKAPAAKKEPAAKKAPAKGKGKRAAKEEDDVAPPLKKSAKAPAAKKEPAAKALPKGKAAAEPEEGGGGGGAELMSAGMSVPSVDPKSGLAGGGRVYVDGGNVYSESLDQVDASKGMDKFFTLQVIEATDGSGRFWTFTAWGKSGTKGQTKLLGPCSVAEAVKAFEKKFKEKTKVAWADRQSHAGEEVAGAYTIKSKYFSAAANARDGLAKETGALFQEQCFSGEGRQVHILCFLVEGGTFESPGATGRKFVDAALGKSGVGIQWHAPSAVAAALPQILKDPARNTIWVISGRGGNGFSKANAAKIADFYRAGGGLALWGDNDPYLVEANLVMAELGWGSMVGNYLGTQVVGPSRKPGEPGFNARHPILYGIEKLYEGATIAGMPENLLGRGWVELMRATDKRLLTAYLPPSGKAGPVILHGAFTQLYHGLGQQGQEPFVTNLGTYTVLRGDDVEGEGEGAAAAKPAKKPAAPKK